MAPSERTDMGGAQSRFPTTCWSAILSARTDDDNRRRMTINELAVAYWKPVYCYLRRKGYPNEKAKDLTQDFFCDIVLGCELIQKADQKRGRFRTLLLTALERRVITIARYESRDIRLPKGGIVNLDFQDLANVDSIGDSATPEQSFHYAWITDLLDQVIAEVQEYYCSNGMKTHWEVFQLRTLKPTLEGGKPTPYETICARFGIKGPAKASNMEITVKRRFKAVLMRRLRDLTGSDAAAEEEFREILDFLSRVRAG